MTQPDHVTSSSRSRIGSNIFCVVIYDNFILRCRSIRRSSVVGCEPKEMNDPFDPAALDGLSRLFSYRKAYQSTVSMPLPSANRSRALNRIIKCQDQDISS